MKKTHIATKTNTNELVIFLGEKKYRVIHEFIHPIKNEKLFCFVSTKKILPNTYPLHTIFQKEKYANIFNAETQESINNHLEK